MAEILTLPGEKMIFLFHSIAEFFAEQLIDRFVNTGMRFQQHGLGIDVGIAVAVRIPLRAGEVEVEVCLRAVPPGTAQAGKAVAYVPIGIAVSVNPVVHAVRPLFWLRLFPAADGVDGGNDDAAMRLFQMAQGIHDGRAAVAVTDENDIRRGVELAECGEVALQFPGAVEKQVAGAAVPGIIGSQLSAGAGQQGHALVCFAEVQQNLFRESAHKNDRQVGLLRRKRLLAASPDESLCRCRVNTGDCIRLPLLLTGWCQQQEGKGQ